MADYEAIKQAYAEAKTAHAELVTAVATQAGRLATLEKLLADAGIAVPNDAAPNAAEANTQSVELAAVATAGAACAVPQLYSHAETLAALPQENYNKTSELQDTLIETLSTYSVEMKAAFIDHFPRDVKKPAEPPKKGHFRKTQKAEPAPGLVGWGEEGHPAKYNFSCAYELSGSEADAKPLLKSFAVKQELPGIGDLRTTAGFTDGSITQLSVEWSAAAPKGNGIDASDKLLKIIGDGNQTFKPFFDQLTAPVRIRRDGNKHAETPSNRASMQLQLDESPRPLQLTLTRESNECDGLSVSAIFQYDQVSSTFVQPYNAAAKKTLSADEFMGYVRFALGTIPTQERINYNA